MYSEKELAAIAKRENNNKRKYLVVNRLQGKHVPASPSEVFSMFHELADTVSEAYKDEKLLLIGFAETATAVGAALAVRMNTYYMQTTREDIEGVEYLFFSEAHSHATEQRIVKTDLDGIVNEIDRVIFVEDEVTTGNTILNIVDILEKEYEKKLQFSVASLLNGMNESSKQIFLDRNIGMHYLVKTNHDRYTEIAEQYHGNGSYYSCSLKRPDMAYQEIRLSNYRNARRLNQGNDYQMACEHLYQELNTKLHLESGKKILVAGTEEFMYPALFAAKKLEETGNWVKCHSTTRSPIAVSMEEDYPLHARYELASLYEGARRTFIYDIGIYDEVIIITDAENEEEQGINSLVNALCSCGNQKISFVRWGSF